MRPNFARASWYIARTWSESVTSAWIASSPSASTSMSTPTTFAPSSANSRHDSAPMPDAAPVMTQTFPASLPGISPPPSRSRRS